MQTALAYRQQQYGLNEAQAHDQKAGTVLGRLCLAGDITEAQYDAGTRYRERYNEVQRALHVPPDLSLTHPGSPPQWRTKQTPEEYIDWAVRVVANWKVFEMKGWPVLREVVIEDKPASAGMLAELRVALSILAKKFGVESYVTEAT